MGGRGIERNGTQIFFFCQTTLRNNRNNEFSFRIDPTGAFPQTPKCSYLESTIQTGSLLPLFLRQSKGWKLKHFFNWTNFNNISFKTNNSETCIDPKCIKLTHLYLWYSADLYHVGTPHTMLFFPEHHLPHLLRVCPLEMRSMRMPQRQRCSENVLEAEE